MGIVSSVLVGTECFIMGLDAMKVKGPEDIKSLLISHLRAVRSHPRLRNAYVLSSSQKIILGTGSSAYGSHAERTNALFTRSKRRTAWA